MTGLDPESYELACTILASANELTLATIGAQGWPHASTVSFASEGLMLVAAIALDSHKAHDIRRDGRVSLTVNAPFRNWNEIQGLSIDGVASMIEGRIDQAAAASLILKKLPAYAALVGEAAPIPWPGMLFIRIVPSVLTLLDYTKRFGHSEQFTLIPAAPQPDRATPP